MKQALKIFFQEFKRIVISLAQWLTAILGMNDDSKYSKVLRRIVGTCFATIMAIIAIAFLMKVYDYCNYKLGFRSEYYYEPECIFGGVTFYKGQDNDGYITAVNGKKTITTVAWIAMPSGNDSLACFSNGKKMGYFNIISGALAIKPKYDHAWIFSEGLASVDDKGKIKFIDTNGNIVIDPNTPYIANIEGYIFYDGHCAIHDTDGRKMGIINRDGRWEIAPTYEDICKRDSFWILNEGERQSVLNANLDTIISPINAHFEIDEGYIYATMEDHTMRRYDSLGKSIDDFYVSNVETMSYDSDDIIYATKEIYDPDALEEENATSHIVKTAQCLRYQAEQGYYGLMNPLGQIITPPIYTSITAIDSNLYLCKEYDDFGVVLDGKGRHVEYGH